MAMIDSNNFITHLVWSGLIDKATCGQLKEAIELCTVDAVPKSELWNMRREIENLPKLYPYTDHIDSYCKSSEILQIIDKYMENEDNK